MSEIFTDAGKHINDTSPTSSRNASSPHSSVASIVKEILYYDMSGEKYLTIFNHYSYENTKYFHYKKPPSRIGTHQDVTRLTNVFKDMDYKVTVHNNMVYSEIIDIIIEISKQDHKQTSCLCFVFLTHGLQGGDLFAADRPYQFRDVTTLLENGHPSIVGKPKIFFVQGYSVKYKFEIEAHSSEAVHFEGGSMIKRIDTLTLVNNHTLLEDDEVGLGWSVVDYSHFKACRGDQVDSGRKVTIDGPEVSLNIPTHADFLILYSSVENFVSYRDSNGSFLVQELCDVIEEYHKVWDILHIITLVHRRVAYYRTTYAPTNPSIHDKKQMPETRFSLTKLFKF